MNKTRRLLLKMISVLPFLGWLTPVTGVVSHARKYHADKWYIYDDDCNWDEYGDTWKTPGPPSET